MSASVTVPYTTVDLRNVYLDDAGVLRYTKRGVTLRASGWERLRDASAAVETALPCTKDHQNLQDALDCGKCGQPQQTPNDGFM